MLLSSYPIPAPPSSTISSTPIGVHWYTSSDEAAALLSLGDTAAVQTSSGETSPAPFFRLQSISTGANAIAAPQSTVGAPRDPVGETSPGPLLLQPSVPVPANPCPPPGTNLHPLLAPNLSPSAHIPHGPNAGGAADPTHDASSVPPVRLGAAAPPSPPTEGSAFVLNAGAQPEPFLRLPDIPNVPNAASIFSFNDPSHAWMNQRPYNVLGFLGRGGFGTVHKVELLTPLGFTVECDEAGLPDFDGTMTTLLKRTTNHLGPIPIPATEGPKLNRSGLCFALKKMEPGSDGSDWADCLREIKLLRTLKKVLILFVGRLISLDCHEFRLVAYGCTVFFLR